MGGLEVVMGSGCSKHKFTPVGLRDLANREMHVTEKKKVSKPEHSARPWRLFYIYLKVPTRWHPGFYS